MYLLEAYMAEKNKHVDLRAFKIQSHYLSQNSSGYLDDLIDKLKNTSVKDR